MLPFNTIRTLEKCIFSFIIIGKPSQLHSLNFKMHVNCLKSHLIAKLMPNAIYTLIRQVYK